MPRNARCVEPGLAYHVTQRGTNRERVFFTISDYQLYLKLLRSQLGTTHVEVLAYCLMPNHVHLVVVPQAADALGTLFRRVHGGFAQYANLRRGRTGHLWQQRFFSCPMGEQHLWIGLRYVERNPCRAGLAAAPEQYRWSSAAAHLGIETDRSGVLDMGFWERAGGAARWRELHASAAEAEVEEALRRATYAGKPFGDEEFARRLAEKFQRRWSKPLGQQVAAEENRAIA
jgi:putative transposase